MAARFAVAAAAFCALLWAAAAAQEYQRLHVRSFTLSSDVAAPQLEQPFHVTLTIRVAERVPQLRNVLLPTFFGAEELGDEQQIRQAPGGTTYRETLTLVAHGSGMLSISPAYLDAIDARDGKPKRFISNGLQLSVGGGSNALWRTGRVILFVALDVVLIGAALFVLAAIFVRSRGNVPRVALPQPEPPAAQPPKDDVREAWDTLQQRRDRPAVLNLRAALWKAAGASSGETLGDVLRRVPAADDRVRRLLTLVERASFIDRSRFDAAVEEVLCSPR